MQNKLKPKYNFGDVVILPNKEISVIAGIIYRTTQANVFRAELDYTTPPKYKIVGYPNFLTEKEIVLVNEQ